MKRQIQNEPNVAQVRKVDHNTYRVMYKNGNVSYRLHNTDIVTFMPDGSVKLTSGGFKTRTTKDRLNKFSTFDISQKNFEWTVDDKFPFFDGMVIKDGKVINSPEAIREAEKEEADNMFGAISMVAMMGDLMTDSQEESNAWKKRMLKAGLENKGLRFPDDFDSLPEDEKQRRLDAAIEMLK